MQLIQQRNPQLVLMIIHMLELAKQCMALSRYLLRLPHNSAFFTLV
jgi:hypothetical protein